MRLADALARTRAVAATETRQSTPGGGQPILSGSVTRPSLVVLAPDAEPLNVGAGPLGGVGAEQGMGRGVHVAVQLTVPVSQIEPTGCSPDGVDQLSEVILSVPAAFAGGENEPAITSVKSKSPGPPSEMVSLKA